MICSKGGQMFGKSHCCPEFSSVVGIPPKNKKKEKSTFEKYKKDWNKANIM